MIFYQDYVLFPIALDADENILYFDEDDLKIFTRSQDVQDHHKILHTLNIDLNCINLDDKNFDEDDSNTIIHARIFASHIKFEKRKKLKKR